MGNKQSRKYLNQHTRNSSDVNLSNQRRQDYERERQEYLAKVCSLSTQPTRPPGTHASEVTQTKRDVDAGPSKATQMTQVIPQPHTPTAQSLQTTQSIQLIQTAQSIIQTSQSIHPIETAQSMQTAQSLQTVQTAQNIQTAQSIHNAQSIQRTPREILITQNIQTKQIRSRDDTAQTTFATPKVQSTRNTQNVLTTTNTLNSQGINKPRNLESTQNEMRESALIERDLLNRKCEINEPPECAIIERDILNRQRELSEQRKCGLIGQDVLNWQRGINEQRECALIKQDVLNRQLDVNEPRECALIERDILNRQREINKQRETQDSLKKQDKLNEPGFNDRQVLSENNSSCPAQNPAAIENANLPDASSSRFEPNQNKEVLQTREQSMTLMDMVEKKQPVKLWSLPDANTVQTERPLGKRAQLVFVKRSGTVGTEHTDSALSTDDVNQARNQQKQFYETQLQEYLAKKRSPSTEPPRPVGTRASEITQTNRDAAEAGPSKATQANVQITQNATTNKFITHGIKSTELNLVRNQQSQYYETQRQEYMARGNFLNTQSTRQAGTQPSKITQTNRDAESSCPAQNPGALQNASLPGTSSSRLELNQNTDAHQTSEQRLMIGNKLETPTKVGLLSDTTSHNTVVESTDTIPNLMEVHMENPTAQHTLVFKRSEQTDWRNDLDQLMCSTCKMKIVPPIYECNHRHSSCIDCKNRGRRCGVCGQDILQIPSNKKVPCPNANRGCVLYIRNLELNRHVGECPFKEMQCPAGCFLMMHMSKLSSHFKSYHPYQLSRLGAKLKLCNISRNSQNVQLVVINGFNFLFFVMVSVSERMIYMAVQLISTRASSSQWSYSIELYNENECNRSYNFTDICTSYFEPIADIFRNYKCCIIPHVYASTMTNNGDLTYKVFIKRNETRRR